MKTGSIAVILFISLVFFLCGGSSTSVKLGECPLTITVKADDADFDGFANVYIDSKFIGTTDSQSQTLRINLKKGEYTIIVIAEGYTPWKNKITLLGEGYKQSALARLKKAPQKADTKEIP